MVSEEGNAGVNAGGVRELQEAQMLQEVALTHLYPEGECHCVACGGHSPQIGEVSSLWQSMSGTPASQEAIRPLLLLKNRTTPFCCMSDTLPRKQGRSTGAHHNPLAEEDSIARKTTRQIPKNAPGKSVI
jgi:hypothetical protein